MSKKTKTIDLVLGWTSHGLVYASIMITLFFFF